MKNLKTLALVLVLPVLAISSYSSFAHEGKEGGGCHGKHDLMKLDTDKDGKITQKEFMDKSAERAQAMFSKLDTNKDGVIDAAEEKAWKEKMAQHHGHWWKKQADKPATAEPVPHPDKTN